MTREEHIARATLHLLDAANDNDTPQKYYDELRGAPLIEFDAGGQLTYYRLEEVVADLRNGSIYPFNRPSPASPSLWSRINSFFSQLPTN